MAKHRAQDDGKSTTYTTKTYDGRHRKEEQETTPLTRGVGTDSRLRTIGDVKKEK